MEPQQQPLAPFNGFDNLGQHGGISYGSPLSVFKAGKPVVHRAEEEPCKSCKHSALNMPYGGKSEYECCNGAYNCLTREIPPEFKPCPLCGGKMTLMTSGADGFAWLECPNPDCLIDDTFTRPDVYELARDWNCPKRVK